MTCLILNIFKGLMDGTVLAPALLQGLPTMAPLPTLAACPQCTPFRRDRDAWLAAVRDCPRCSALLEAYEAEAWTASDEEEGERLEQLEHFDPALLPELDEAPRLAGELLVGDLAEQWSQAERTPRFQHWGLVQWLLGESERLRNRRPRISHARAELAAALAEILDPERYHPAWVADLNAKALAFLARAERRLGRLREAERLSIRAGVWAVRGTNGGRARRFLGDPPATHRLERVAGPALPEGAGARERGGERDKMPPCPPPSSSRPRRVPEA